jgi:hypothetical protein
MEKFRRRRSRLEIFLIDTRWTLNFHEIGSGQPLKSVHLRVGLTK